MECSLQIDEAITVERGSSIICQYVVPFPLVKAMYEPLTEGNYNLIKVEMSSYVLHSRRLTY